MSETFIQIDSLQHLKIYEIRTRYGYKIRRHKQQVVMQFLCENTSFFKFFQQKK